RHSGSLDESMRTMPTLRGHQATRSGLGRRRVVMTLATWSAFVALLVLVPPAPGGLAAWQGFLLAVPFMLATAWLGWVAAAVIAPVALSLVWLRASLTDAALPTGVYLELAAAMALAAVAGD